METKTRGGDIKFWIGAFVMKTATKVQKTGFERRKLLANEFTLRPNSRGSTRNNNEKILIKKKKKKRFKLQVSQYKLYNQPSPSIS